VADRIKVSAVSYTNSYPFIFGLNNHPVANDIDLQLDIPAECARKLLEGEVGLGLVPVAIIPQLKDAYIVSNKCIGADGAVESVCLFSEVPLEQIEEIMLDYQSRTSVRLVKFLAVNHWNIAPKWVEASENFIDSIKGRRAGVVIGDRAFPLLHRFPVVKDLAFEWKQCTGLPFVFACWVANRPLGNAFEEKFNEALQQGLNNRALAIQTMAISDHDALTRYVQQMIQYELDDKKQEAMKLFLSWSSNAS
jgi:chorismate dehydratase